MNTWDEYIRRNPLIQGGGGSQQVLANCEILFLYPAKTRSSSHSHNIHHTMVCLIIAPHCQLVCLTLAPPQLSTDMPYYSTPLPISTGLPYCCTSPSLSTGLAPFPTLSTGLYYCINPTLSSGPPFLSTIPPHNIQWSALLQPSHPQYPLIHTSLAPHTIQWSILLCHPPHYPLVCLTVASPTISNGPPFFSTPSPQYPVVCLTISPHTIYWSVLMCHPTPTSSTGPPYPPKHNPLSASP